MINDGVCCRRLRGVKYVRGPSDHGKGVSLVTIESGVPSFTIWRSFVKFPSIVRGVEGGLLPVKVNQ